MESDPSGERRSHRTSARQTCRQRGATWFCRVRECATHPKSPAKILSNSFPGYHGTERATDVRRRSLTTGIGDGSWSWFPNCPGDLRRISEVARVCASQPGPSAGVGVGKAEQRAAKV